MYMFMNFHVFTAFLFGQTLPPYATCPHQVSGMVADGLGLDKRLCRQASPKSISKIIGAKMKKSFRTILTIIINDSLLNYFCLKIDEFENCMDVFQWARFFYCRMMNPFFFVRSARATKMAASTMASWDLPKLPQS